MALAGAPSEGADPAEDGKNLFANTEYSENQLIISQIIIFPLRHYALPEGLKVHTST